jgi:hypothetical protein
VRLAFDVEDLDCPVRGAGRETATVIVEDGIVLAGSVAVLSAGGTLTIMSS